jgi:hypothetical protein
VAHASNLAVQEVEVRRISSGKKSRTAPPHVGQLKKLGVVECTCHPNYAGSINRRIMVQSSPSINVRPYLKSSQSMHVLVAHAYNPSCLEG